jgi:AraC-like DNA-binding protein
LDRRLAGFAKQLLNLTELAPMVNLSAGCFVYSLAAPVVLAKPMKNAANTLTKKEAEATKTVQSFFKAYMSQRLSSVQEWQSLAERAQFRAQELASLCQVSLRTLQRHFRQNYGLTVSKWLRDIRLRQAYGLLLQGSSVKEVAYDLGYKQLSHFSRDFKDYFGVSPSFLLGVPKIADFPTSGMSTLAPLGFEQMLAV